MKLKKLTAMCMAATVVATAVFSGCGTDAETSGKQEEKQEDKQEESEKKEEASGEKKKITMACWLDEEAFSDENATKNYIEDKFGVEFELISLSGADAETKINLLLSSEEDCPDVFVTGFTYDKAYELGKEGVFIPLNDLMEQYGDNMKHLFEIRPEYMNRTICPDGNIYGILSPKEPYFTTIYPKMWYNKEWLAALNLKEPETTDEFEAMLKAVKESDYNGNGKADEIPLTGNIEHSSPIEWALLNFFISCNSTTLSHMKDGKVELAVDTDEFRQGLEWIKKLYDQELIDPVAFSQTNEQMKQVIRSDIKRVFAYTDDHHGMGVDSGIREHNLLIDAMPPVEGPTGARFAQSTAYADMRINTEAQWFITDKCECPEIAFQIGDFLLSNDASMMCNYGKEGQWWGKEKDESGNTVYWGRALQKDEDENEYRTHRFYLNMHNGLEGEDGIPMLEPEVDWGSPDSYDAHQRAATDKISPYIDKDYIPKNLILLQGEEMEEFATIQPLLQDYVKSAVVQFITGEKNIEKDWDSYLEDLQGYHADRYVELLQKATDLYYES